ncbi:hypothetical protein X975_20077, partial [Stegodyphus mimosarum]
MDIVGPLPMTLSGHKYILVITDYFTRWPEAYALQNCSSETIIEKLELFIASHGVPQHIITDRGTNFISQ